jgi:hypothetical protein
LAAFFAVPLIKYTLTRNLLPINRDYATKTILSRGDNSVPSTWTGKKLANPDTDGNSIKPPVSCKGSS